MLFATFIALIVCPNFVRAEMDDSKADRVEVMVSVAEQKLALVRNGELVRTYAISTSRFGVGDDYGTYRTPLGKLRISEKIGDGLAAGAVFRHRTPTGEVLAPNAPGRDPIVSRILWLDGLDECNRNAYGRCVYIHGTPDERHLGRPVSYGCIRMRSCDVIELYAATPVGTEVSIIKGRLPFGGRGWLEMLASIASAPSNRPEPVRL
ncbi:MAG: L,D-transpeptidase [Terrimicrobiaceae bacterium]|nr:L,D-transpeptidase [Terrimicrobiaceae bacterium]